MEADLLSRARRGDHAAFEGLVAPLRRELEVHCYRMLGSLQDAEDVLQETLLAAWSTLEAFEGRASVRTWLYRIATNRCLNARRTARRRSWAAAQLPVPAPDPTRLGEVLWLEPLPDALLDEVPDSAPGPDARFEERDAVSLAFVTALQLLPPRQRAALVLRDVLGFRAAEVADMLQSTTESVNSALKRARATLSRRVPDPAGDVGGPQSGVDQALLERFVRAWEAGDVGALVDVLAEGVWMTMPPLPLEYHGRDLAIRFLVAVAFRDGRRYRLVPTMANRAPAFGAYLRDPAGGDAQAMGLLAITVDRGAVTAVTRFDAATMARFGFPPTLADAAPDPVGLPVAPRAIAR